MVSSALKDREQGKQTGVARATASSSDRQLTQEGGERKRA